VSRIAVIVCVDWDKDGSYATAGDDITAYVEQVDCPQQGLYGGQQSGIDNVAAIGTLKITLDNMDKRFSPRNTSGPLYGKLKGNRPVRVQVTDGVTTWNAFVGVVTRITPDAAENGTRRAVLNCEDRMGQLQAHKLGLPLQEDRRGDELLRLIAASAFGGVAASGTVTFAAQPANNDSVTIGAHTYTFKTTLTGAAYEVKIGTSADDTLSNLIAAINADIGAGTAYGTGTVRHELVTASGAGGASDVQQQHNFATYFKTIGNLGGADYIAAQQFVPGVTGNITEIEIFLYGGNGVGDITLEVWSDDGSNAPDSMLYSTTYTPTTDTDPTAGTNTILPASAWGVVADTKYFIVQYPTTAQAANHYWLWGGSNIDAYPAGVTLYSTTAGASWSVSSTEAWFTVVTSPQPAILANARGTWGNAIGLGKSGANITVSAAALSGGTDGPVTLTFDTSTLTHGIAADQWAEDITNAMSAATDVIASEGTALLWAAEDGSIVYKDKNWFFTQAVAAPTLTIDGQMNELANAVDIYGVHNEVVVTYRPRGVGTANTVIAKSNGTLEIPLTTRSPRWNSTLNLPDGGKYVVKLPFVDSVGDIIGATDVITPLEGTDFRYFESVGGREYTGRGEVVATVAVTATGVEVTWLNLGGTPFYVTEFQVRGTPIISYDQQAAIRQDATSIAEYGKRSHSEDLPLYSTQQFAESYADYLLFAFTDDIQRINGIDMQAQQVVSGVNLFGIQIGDVLALTNDQLGVTAVKVLVVGRPWSWTRGGATAIKYDVRALDAVNYLILDDPVYGLLDGTNVLGFM